jgi:hypothetical protein
MVNIIQTRKIVVLAIIILTFINCNKILGKTCWKCEVTRMNGTTYTDRVCRDDNNIPQFQDDNGNDLNSFCERD